MQISFSWWTRSHVVLVIKDLEQNCGRSVITQFLGRRAEIFFQAVGASWAAFLSIVGDTTNQTCQAKSQILVGESSRTADTVVGVKGTEVGAVIIALPLFP